MVCPVVGRCLQSRFRTLWAAPVCSARRALGSGAFPHAEVADPLVAHHVYDAAKVADLPTLLLITRSAAASEFKDVGFWRSCSISIQRLTRDAALSDLANVLDEVARAGFRDDELVYKISDHCTARAQELDSDTLAALLRAHARLAFRNERTIGVLQNCLYEQMRTSRTTASGLSSSLWSLSVLAAKSCCARPTPDLLEGVLRMATEHVQFFTISQLCDVLQALELLGLRGDRQAAVLLAKIGDMLARDAQQLSSSHCATAVRVFAKCRVHDERLLETVAAVLRDKSVRSALAPNEIRDTLYGYAKFSHQDTALLDLMSIEACRSFHHMDVALVGNVLASFAKTNTSSTVLAKRAVTRVKRCPLADLASVPLTDMITLCMSFAKMQIRDTVMFDHCAESFLQRSETPLREARAADLINIVHSFTKVHAFHHELFREIGRLLQNRFDELGLPDIVKYLHGIAKVQHSPPPVLQEKISEAFGVEKMLSLDVFDLLKLATAARRLGFRIPSLEKHVSAVLPHEPDDAIATAGPSRRVTSQSPRKYHKSARKRKWTW